MLKTLTIQQIIDSSEQGDLQLRPDFQRRPNWPKHAQCYFIDTILRGYPSPLIYLRPRIDPTTDRPIRDVVDGQQRLVSIMAFSKNELKLDSGTGEYENLTFEELDPEDQRRFLSYQIGVDELLNASDDYVINVFHRLNAFGLRLNPQELRHGRYLGKQYKGVFRSAVIDAAKRWHVLWERHKVVSVRGRLRMADDQLVAEMFGVLLDGVSDGGQPNINKLYERYDKGMPEGTSERFDRTVEFVVSHFIEDLTPRLKGSPHFLMLFAATAHALSGIPKGDMGRGVNPNLPTRSNDALTNVEIGRQNLTKLGDILKLKVDDVPPTFFEFRLASAGTTHRISSRSQRFITFYRALLPELL